MPKIRKKPFTSVASYRARNDRYGDNKYPGNCSGRLIIDLIKYFGGTWVLDPMEGGGTCRDVCKVLGIKYNGYDLTKGDDMFDAPWAQYKTITEVKRPDFIFWHPPYWRMVRYDKKVHGDGRDMSALPWKGFCQQLILGAEMLLDTLAIGGHLAILMGTFRHAGKFYRPWIELMQWRDTCEPEIVKVQHNTSSMSNYYHGHKFIPVAHEMCLVWKKTEETPDVEVTEEEEAAVAEPPKKPRKKRAKKKATAKSEPMVKKSVKICDAGYRDDT